MLCRLAVTLVVTLAAAAAAQANTITLSGNVYDGNGGPLQKGNVYHVLGPVIVPAGQKLTIEPGVPVKFSSGCNINVDGLLDAQGTDLERIIFSSIKDDQAGGDTNLDGGASSPAPGDWKGLWFTGASDGSIMTYADVRFASTATNSGAIELQNTVIVFDHLLVTDCTWTGLNLDESNVNNDATVTNCDFVRCAQPIGGVALDSLKQLLNNTSTDCTNGDYARMISNDFGFHADADLSAANFVNGVQVGGFGVLDGVKVTLRAGSIVKLGGGWYPSIEVAGTLELLGQAGNEVVITSFHDDAWGGDTDDNGSAVLPAPGDWSTLVVGDLFANHETFLAEHVVLRYGGASNNNMVSVGGRETATLRDCVIEKGMRHGLYLGNSLQPLIVERCAVNDNGGIAFVDASFQNLLTMFDNTATGNAKGDYLRVLTATLGAITDFTIGPRNYPGSVLVLATSVDIPGGKTLELLPGTIVKFEPSAGRFNANQGAFKFVGTPEQPIVITSLRDDAIGGDTNKDGATTLPAPGDFGGITLAVNADPCELEHVLLRYGGNSEAQLRCRAAQASVRSVRSEFSKLAAIQAEAHSSVGGPARNWVAVDSQGIGIELVGGSFTVANATAAGNAGVGIKHTAQWTGKLASSITWGNAGGNFSGFSGSEVSYCDGGFAGSNGNLNVDPLFVDAANGDYTLQAGSPCLESGDPADLPTGTDARGLPRLLDRDFDRALRVDMGAFEGGHLTLAVSGDFTPGGSVTLASDGTPGLPALLFIGFGESELLFKPYGTLFIDLAQTWYLVPWLPAPATVNGTLPAPLPTPLLVLFQGVALSGRSGNLSNLARMLIE